MITAPFFSRFFNDAIYRFGQFPNTLDGVVAMVGIPHIANNDRRFIRLPSLLGSRGMKFPAAFRRFNSFAKFQFKR